MIPGTSLVFQWSELCFNLQGWNCAPWLGTKNLCLLVKTKQENRNSVVTVNKDFKNGPSKKSFKNRV